MYDKLLKPRQSFWITLYICVFVYIYVCVCVCVCIYIYIYMYLFILQTAQSKFHFTECPLHQALTTAVSHHTKAGTSCDSCQGHDKRDKLLPHIFCDGSAVQNGKQEWGKENTYVFHELVWPCARICIAIWGEVFVSLAAVSAINCPSSLTSAFTWWDLVLRKPTWQH